MMRHRGALIGAVLLAGLHTMAAKGWDDYPGLQASGIAGVVMGDFDGNGKREVAIGGQPEPYYSNSYAMLGVLGANSSGALGLRSISMLPTPVNGALVLAAREGSADRLAVAVGSDVTAQILILGGIPLRIVRTIEAPLVQRVIAVADIDADGRPEIVALAGTSPWNDSHLTVLDYQTGAVEWVGSDMATDVGIAQLDGDAALEMIVAGTPGRIIDGATHAVEWTYPSGFVSKIVVGRFDANPAVVGFAVTSPNSNRVQVFRSQPYSPVSEFYTSGTGIGISAAAVVHTSAGGPDQIAFGVGGVSIYDPRTGQRITQVPYSYDGVMALSAGDIDGDGHEELVSGASSRIQATDLVTANIDYVEASDPGPHSAVAIGDLSGTGVEQVAYLTNSTSQQRSVLRVLDAASGARLRKQDAVMNSWTREPPQIAIAQLDSDPQKEIIVAGANMYSGEVAVIDGVSLADQWRVGGYNSVFGDASVRALAIIDANGDGTPDVAVATSTGRVVVLDGRSGALLWQSVTLDGTTPPSLAVTHEASGKSRLGVTRGKGLYVFDMSSHLLVASTKSTAPLVGVWSWGEASACRIATLDEAAVATIYRCDTLNVEAQRLMPTGTVFFRPLDQQGRRFMAASGAYLYEVAPDGSAVAISGAMGDHLGATNSGIVRNGSDAQHFDVIIGSDYMVTRRQIGLDAIFAYGFD